MRNNEALRREHELVRNDVAFYDFTLETLEVSGKDARAFLDYIFVNSLAKLKPGKALYTSMLDEDGYMIDDLILFCREDDKFWVTTGMIDQLKDWVNKHVGDREVTFKDITDQLAIYAVQGPNSKDVINKVLEDNVDDLKSFNFKDSRTAGGVDVMVARTGFTGELGYELHFNPNQMEAVAKELQDNGVELIEAAEVTLASIPMEKGFVQAHDFLGINTVESGLGWTVKGGKDYIGKERTEQYKNEGPARRLLGFTVDEEDANVEQDNVVELNGEEIGKVTAYTYGYTLEKNIGYALVDAKANAGDEVTIKTNNGDVKAVLAVKEFS